MYTKFIDEQIILPEDMKFRLEDLAFLFRQDKMITNLKV
jgi:hypothetical protein